MVERNAEARFWSKVNKTETCWLWTRPLNPSGYAYFKLERRDQLVHRVSYEWAYGPIPDGLVLDHLCRVRHCVRPDHLEAVTQQVNILRGDGLAAAEVKRTHCPRGHPYDEDNTRPDGHGHRRCRQCHRDSDRERMRRIRAAERQNRCSAD